MAVIHKYPRKTWNCDCDFKEFIISGRMLNRKRIYVQCKCGDWEYDLTKFIKKGGAK